MAYPTSLDSFPSAGTLAAENLSTGPHSALHGNLGASVAAVQAKVGVNGSGAATSLDYRIATLEAGGGGGSGSAGTGTPFNVQAGIVGYAQPVLPANNAADNTTALQAILDLGAFGAQQLMFPPGVYNLNTIFLRYSGQRLFGFDNVSSVLNYQGTGAGNAFIHMRPGNADGDGDSFGARTNNSGLEDLTVRNSGTGASIGLRIRNGTHHRFNRVRFQYWERNAINASNFADSQFYSPEFEGNGSQTDANYSVVDFNGDQGAWACDQVKFIAGRWEGNGDMCFRATDGNGNYVGKIFFAGCKFESGGAMGGTDAQFSLTNANQISFEQCDWTLQDMRGGHATIPSMIHMQGTSGVQISNSQVHLGGGSTKLFTYIVDIDAADSILMCTNFLIDSEMGSSAYFPTNIVRAQGTPTVKFSVCGYGGGGRTHAPTWLAGATQTADMPY